MLFFPEISANFQSNTIINIANLLDLTIQAQTFSCSDAKKKTVIFSKTLYNVDIDEKNILLLRCTYTLKFAQEVGLSAKFKIKFSP